MDVGDLNTVDADLRGSTSEHLNALCLSAIVGGRRNKVVSIEIKLEINTFE